MEKKYQINPMISLAVNMADGKRRFVLFCGAGISKDAGIATGKDILLNTLGKIYQQEFQKESYSREDVLGWFEKNKDLHDMPYSKILDQIYPGMEQRRLYLNNFFENKQPGEIHMLIAKMVQLGLIRFIITTNFDNLLEKALDSEGLKDKISVLSTNDQAKNSDTWDKVEVCRIYKIHGDKDQGTIRNSPKELKKLDRYIEKDLQELINRHGVIVLGYSGEDEGVLRCFERREYHRYPICWQYRDEPNKDVLRIMNNQEGTLIHNESASSFLHELLDRIELIRRTSENDSLEVLKTRYEQVLVNSNPLQIKARIEEERHRFISDTKFICDSFQQNPAWQDLWNAYLDLINKSIPNIILAEQILRFNLEEPWEEFLPFFNELHSINTNRDRYGVGGLINYLFYSLFLMIGSRLLKYERFKGIKKLFSLKQLTQHQVKNILDWNVQASFIEQKASEDTKNWYVPKFHYLLGVIESGKWPFNAAEIKELTTDFDILCFVYGVKHSSPRDSRSWFPRSAYYFEYRSPVFIKKIKYDDEYCARIAKDLFDNTQDKFNQFLRDQVITSYRDLSQQMSGSPENPFAELERQ